MKVIAIDPGFFQIKIVEIETTFRGYMLQNSYEIQVPEEVQDLSAQATLIKEFLRERGLDSARMVWVLPQSHLTYRRIEFPIKDLKKAMKSLRFQIEDAIPYELDDVWMDTSYTTGPKGVVAASAIIPKEKLQQIIDHLNEGGLDPNVITAGLSTYPLLFPHLRSQRAGYEKVAVLDLGHLQNHLYFFHDDVLELYQTSPTAGRDLTLEIARTYGIHYDEAQKVKHENGFILTEASKTANYTDDQIAFSNTIETVVKKITSELKHGLLAYRGKTESQLDKILITGGSSLIPGLAAYLTEKTGLPVEKLEVIQKIRPSSLSSNERLESKLPLALGGALSQTVKKNPLPINFRKGEFARKGAHTGFNLSDLSWPIARFAVILIAIQISFGILSIIKSYQIDDLRKELYRAMNRNEIAISDTPLRRSQKGRYQDEPERLIQRIERRVSNKKKQIKSIQMAREGAIRSLNKLIQMFPDTPRLAVISLSIDSGSADLVVSVDSEQEAQKLKQRLQRSKTFNLSNFEVRENEPSKDWEASFVLAKTTTDEEES